MKKSEKINVVATIIGIAVIAGSYASYVFTVKKEIKKLSETE